MRRYSVDQDECLSDEERFHTPSWWSREEFPASDTDYPSVVILKQGQWPYHTAASSIFQALWQKVVLSEGRFKARISEPKKIRTDGKLWKSQDFCSTSWHVTYVAVNSGWPTWQLPKWGLGFFIERPNMRLNRSNTNSGEALSVQRTSHVVDVRHDAPGYVWQGKLWLKSTFRKNAASFPCAQGMEHSYNPLHDLVCQSYEERKLTRSNIARSGQREVPLQHWAFAGVFE